MVQWNICNRCGMQARNTCSSGDLVPPPFWDLLMILLFGPFLSKICVIFFLLFTMNVPRYFLDFVFWLHVHFKGITYTSFWKYTSNFAKRWRAINERHSKCKRIKGHCQGQWSMFSNRAWCFVLLFLLFNHTDYLEYRAKTLYTTFTSYKKKMLLHFLINKANSFVALFCPSVYFLSLL